MLDENYTSKNWTSKLEIMPVKEWLGHLEIGTTFHSSSFGQFSGWISALPSAMSKNEYVKNVN